MADDFEKYKPKVPPDLRRDLMMTHAELAHRLEDNPTGEGKRLLEQYRGCLHDSGLSGRLKAPEPIQELDGANADLHASVALLGGLLLSKINLNLQKCTAEADGLVGKTDEASITRLAEVLHEQHGLNLRMESWMRHLGPIIQRGAVLTTVVKQHIEKLDEAQLAGVIERPPEETMKLSADAEMMAGRMLADLKQLHHLVKQDRDSRTLADPVEASLYGVVLDQLIPRIENLAKLVAMDSVNIATHWPMDDEVPRWEKAVAPPAERKRGFAMDADTVKAALARPENRNITSLFGPRERE